MSPDQLASRSQIRPYSRMDFGNYAIDGKERKDLQSGIDELLPLLSLFYSPGAMKAKEQLRKADCRYS